LAGNPANYDQPFFLEHIVQAVMYKGQRVLQSYSNDENRIGKQGCSEKRVGSGLEAVCDRIVPRSENDDHHDRFALHRVNKLRGLAWWREANSRRLPKKLKRMHTTIAVANP
jgi:hypothetical protein